MTTFHVWSISRAGPRYGRREDTMKEKMIAMMIEADPFLGESIAREIADLLSEDEIIDNINQLMDLLRD